MHGVRYFEKGKTLLHHLRKSNPFPAIFPSLCLSFSLSLAVALSLFFREQQLRSAVGVHAKFNFRSSKGCFASSPTRLYVAITIRTHLERASRFSLVPLVLVTFFIDTLHPLGNLAPLILLVFSLRIPNYVRSCGSKRQLEAIFSSLYVDIYIRRKKYTAFFSSISLSFYFGRSRGSTFLAESDAARPAGSLPSNQKLERAKRK